MMEEEAKRKLKTSELQAKKNRLKIWTNYVPPATNSKAIHDQNFTGKVKFSLTIGLSQIKKDLMVNNIPEDLERDQTTMMLFLLLNYMYLRD